MTANDYKKKVKKVPGHLILAQWLLYSNKSNFEADIFLPGNWVVANGVSVNISASINTSAL